MPYLAISCFIFLFGQTYVTVLAKPFKKTDKVRFFKRFVGFFYNQTNNVKPNYQYTICQNIYLPDKISRYNRIFIKKNLSLSVLKFFCRFFKNSRRQLSEKRKSFGEHYVCKIQKLSLKYKKIFITQL